VDEATWLSCTDPKPLLDFLRGGRTASDRKLRLFAVACCRRIWLHMPDECSRQAVEVGERYADGLTGDETRDAVWQAIRGLKEAAVADQDFERAAHLRGTERPVYDTMRRGTFYISSLVDDRDMCLFLRDIFSNPFRATPAIGPSVLRWNSGTVPRLARAAYEQRSLPEGRLDSSRLAVLADALEEAGCQNDEVLGHFRGQDGHWRGCWVLDAILDKE
jgi:hypothetical protein